MKAELTATEQHCSDIMKFPARRRGGRVAEGGGLLNRYRVKSSIGGSNPPLSATSITYGRFVGQRCDPVFGGRGFFVATVLHGY